MKSRNLSRTAALAALMLAQPASAFITEPETLVYGRIVNRSGGNTDQTLHEGRLTWKIRRPDGSDITLRGEIDRMAGGRFSYLLRVPHQAVSLGQQAENVVVPLSPVVANGCHYTITVGGKPARILAPGTSTFDLSQALRATAYRLDLEIAAPGEDSDGDGMPDWWEDLHGLDKQFAGDGGLDSDGDGRTNRDEYLAGTDPNHDNRKPELLTREVIAYAASTSVVLLETADFDSTPEQVRFELRTLPQGGRLLLRNAAKLPSETAVPLAVGASFTQADVSSGRLVYEHADGEPGSFEVAVSDEKPEHGEMAAAVGVLLFDPPAGMLPVDAAEALRLEAHRFAKQGHLVADLSANSGAHHLSTPSSNLAPAAKSSHLSSFGGESPHILIGGPSADVLTGGAADDILAGGLGSDRLTGGAGADLFVFTSSGDGNDTIADFSPAEGDVINLVGALNGTSRDLTKYVRIRRSGANALLEVSANGTGAGYTDLVVTLENSGFTAGSVADLYYTGHLEAGTIGLPPRFSIVATNPAASENGPADGVVVISREGPLDEPVTLGLQVSGSATNGVDYQMIPGSLVFPAGETALEIRVKPFPDAITEFDEIVQIAITPGSAYALSAASSAQVVIEDLKPGIWAETIERLASVAGPSPGAILLRRGGVTSGSVFVRFALGGSAVRGVDYNDVPTYAEFASGQSSKLVEIVPKTSVSFGASEAKTVTLTLTKDETYHVSGQPARVLIVPEKLTLGAWQARHQEGSGSNADAFLKSDPGNHGMPMLLRYGFATDPANPLASMDRLPRVSVEQGYLTLRFRKKPGITDAIYQVEYSLDFGTWKFGPGDVEDITPQVAPNDPGAAVFRAKKPIADAPSGALRVRMIVPNP